MQKVTPYDTNIYLLDRNAYDSLLKESNENNIVCIEKDYKTVNTLIRSYDQYEDLLLVYSNYQEYFAWQLVSLKTSEKHKIDAIRQELTKLESWLFAVSIPVDHEFPEDSAERLVYKLNYGYNKECDCDLRSFLCLPLSTQLLHSVMLQYNRQARRTGAADWGDIVADDLCGSKLQLNLRVNKKESVVGCGIRKIGRKIGRRVNIGVNVLKVVGERRSDVSSTSTNTNTNTNMGRSSTSKSKINMSTSNTTTNIGRSNTTTSKSKINMSKSKINMSRRTPLSSIIQISTTKRLSSYTPRPKALTSKPVIPNDLQEQMDLIASIKNQH